MPCLPPPRELNTSRIVLSSYQKANLAPGAKLSAASPGAPDAASPTTSTPVALGVQGTANQTVRAARCPSPLELPTLVFGTGRVPGAPSSLAAMRRFPGRVQEARRPGGLVCSRESAEPCVGGARRVSVEASASEANAGPRPAESSSSAQAENASAPAPALASPVASPWMGLLLPAVTKNVAVAAAALQSADIIALPTDTLYGIAGDARSPMAVERIFETKGRDSKKPLPICVADPQDVGRYARVDHLPSGLLEALLPGPVTLVLPCSPDGELAPAVLSGMDTVGVRVPDAAFVRAVARDFGGALALTSANESSSMSSVSVEEFRSLWDKCACVFDAGTISLSGQRAGSTIVELLPRNGGGLNPGCTFRVVRQGSAEAATLEHLKAFGVVPV